MSDLRAELVRRARGGDSEALELLLCAVPRELPAAVRRNVRDHRIIKLALWIISETGFSRHRIAAMLATAGRRIECGRGLSDAAPFAVLTADERAKLTAEIRAILRWVPRWPARRQMLRILSSAAVALTDSSARPSAHEQHHHNETAEIAIDAGRPRGASRAA